MKNPDEKSSSVLFMDSSPASEELEDSKEDLKKLYRDLELGEDFEKSGPSLKKFFTPFVKLKKAQFLAVAKDLSVVSALSGDWNLALELIQKLDAKENSDSLRVWRLRCLIELERFAEAIALVHHVKWESKSLIHVNYLTGLAYEALGIAEQAQLRFKAVFDVDPRYREIRQKFAT
jgi:hypothetical protein